MRTRTLLLIQQRAIEPAIGARQPIGSVHWLAGSVSRGPPLMARGGAYPAGLTEAANPLMMNKLVLVTGALPETPPIRLQDANASLLPLRSMVGQLPLEQHIGVRIPEGQPKSCTRAFGARFSLPSMTPPRTSLDAISHSK